ncbi:hypothetical protein [Zhenhengia yiwuensis]|jgi:hypothetical protein|uniref:Uncharacterized protein n=1 Tax=Zhenhengia yiwuensis TaxID=2763666 RepID=A0A926ELA2_9FIRM|nr:hypothetical protein [Zhenhengia yiwuensis]MBC8581654.1 hypothetical protein [Zhenhengia yiwuensis]MDY3362052.1 hypothetical protein [Clostridium celatum]
MDGTVTISINDFEELRDKAKQFEKLKRTIHNRMYMHFDDEQEEWILYIDQEKMEKVLKDYNPEFEVEGDDILEVIWR